MKPQHIITEQELAAHPEVFPEGAIQGERIDLTDQQLEVLGLELHMVNAADLVNDPSYTRLGLTDGDIIERPILKDSEEDILGE